MAVEFDVAMCEAPGPLASKNTRSPAWTFARDTGAPTPRLLVARAWQGHADLPDA
jgi:hypothetical protein